MMSDPNIKVSVVIPIYRVEEFIEQCLQSVSDSLKEIEILCIDDASPDNSAEIVRRFAARDSRVKLIHNSSNLGVAASRNRGLELATGRYVYVIDSDDFLRVDAVEKLYQCANEGDLDIVLSDAYQYHNKDKVEVYPNPYLGYQLQFWGGHATWWFLFRRTLILDHPDIRFPIGAHPVEDTTFSFMLFAYVRSYGYVAESLLYYRQHANMCMSRIHRDLKDEYLRSLIICLDHMCEFMIQHKRAVKHREYACMNLMTGLINEACKVPGRRRSALTPRTRSFLRRYTAKQFFYRRKTTASGKCMIKICKVPIISIRLDRIRYKRLSRWIGLG